MNINLPIELLEITQMTEIEMLREIAIMLYQQQRIPWEKAAQLGGMTNDDFYQLLLNRNIISSPIDDEDENNALIIASLRTSLQQVKEDKIHPINELWDGIDV
jgi:predicted HTH domain antitoxin